MDRLRFGVVLLLQVFVPVTHAHATGAPTSACGDLVPHHTGVTPQPSPAPYAILTDSNTFRPGHPVTVTLVGPGYRGVLLQAREGNAPDALGSWHLPPPDTKLLQCSGKRNGAVTHSNINLKDNATSYTWVPPSNPATIHFLATVAQQRTVFWLNVSSGTLTKEDGLSPAAGGEARDACVAGVLSAVCLLLLQALG